ncbi:LptA/OstA family protein [Xaviernesmea oryzae]|nr:LptA/OstA family protein [Xaviernesmea oryzae]
MLAAAAQAQTQAPAGSSRMTGMKLSNDQPIQIESDQLEVKDAESKAIFTGNVKVVQGATTLQAGTMVVYYKPRSAGGNGATPAAKNNSAPGGSLTGGNAQIDHIEVEKKVFLSSGTQQATADSGVFNMDAQTLVLKGKEVVLSEGANVFTGCQLDVAMNTGEAKLQACGGRVRIQLDPKSQQQQTPQRSTN